MQAELQENLQRRIGKLWRQVVIGAGISVIILVVTLAVISRNGDSSSSSSNYEITTLISPTMTIDSSIDLSNDFTFTLFRDGYELLSYFDSSNDMKDIATYKMLEDKVAVIEPYQRMKLFVEDEVEGAKYVITACKYDEDGDAVSSEDCVEGSSSEGASNVHFTLECSAFDLYYLEVKEVGSGDNPTKRYSSGFAPCMYIRRNIASLSDGDLTDTMDAMYEIWGNSESDGQEKYGLAFHSIGYFAEAHMFNAAQRDADHIHEGLGFLPQHMKITNMFESAMQAVNPAVSLPYWDYTNESGYLGESFIFTEDTFGSLNAPSIPDKWTYTNDSLEDAAISNGRWKKTKAEVNTQFSDLVNGYGYLRGPWNTNPSPYISRFTLEYVSLPKCSAYYNWLSFDSYTDFLYQASFGPHASVHGDIGGLFGCDVFDQLYDRGLVTSKKKATQVCKKWTIILKELYRANFITARDDCTATELTEDGFDCGFECDASDKDSMRSALSNLIGDSYTGGDLTDGQWEQWRDFVCIGEGFKAFSGDHLEAGSPTDPSFWPIHPSLERLMHAKMMSGGFADPTWPTEPSDVCDKYRCYSTEEDKKGEWDACCVGHYADDQLRDFTSGDVNSGYGETNFEILQGSDPSYDGYKMTYLYDEFSWSHCNTDDSESSSSSYDFPAKIRELKEAAEARLRR